ncbi:MAG: hypothetical protein RSB41_03060 [Bacilli bacterium]
MKYYCTRICHTLKGHLDSTPFFGLTSKKIEEYNLIKGNKKIIVESSSFSTLVREVVTGIRIPKITIVNSLPNNPVSEEIIRKYKADSKREIHTFVTIEDILEVNDTILENYKKVSDLEKLKEYILSEFEFGEELNNPSTEFNEEEAVFKLKR